MDVEIKIINLEETIAKLSALPGAIAQARRRGLKSALSFLRRKSFDWIQSAGEGSWPDFHPLTRMFGDSPKWVKRGRILGTHNWNWLMRYVKYGQSKDNFAGWLKFGQTDEPMSKTSSKRAIQIEQGHRTTVTPAMRRWMGATRPDNVKNPIPGVDYFPLRKTTSTLTIPKRPIIAPIYKKYRDIALREFADSFVKRVEKSI